jgi:hypothetical protein
MIHGELSRGKDTVGVAVVSHKMPGLHTEAQILDSDKKLGDGLNEIWPGWHRPRHPHRAAPGH